MKTISLFIFSMILACSGGPSINEESHTLSNEVGILGLLSSEYSGDQGYESKRAAPSEQQISTEQKIIQTATLRFESRDMDKTHRQIQKVVSENRGFIQDDNSGKNYNEIYRRITIRVPTDLFQKTVDSLSVGVAFFDQKDISRQDVTEEFVDLEARLKAKRELENRYLELLRQAKNVTEMLEIERELSKIREEIEARQGRLNYLENRVSVSTISIYFYKVTSDSGVTTSYGNKMWNAVKSGWNGISLFFLGLIYIWPFLLILIIFLFFLRRYLRRNKNKA